MSDPKTKSVDAATAVDRKVAAVSSPSSRKTQAAQPKSARPRTAGIGSVRDAAEASAAEYQRQRAARDRREA